MNEIDEILLEEYYNTEIEKLNEEFEKWLVNNHFYLKEESANSMEWFLKWKLGYANKLKNSIKSVAIYAQTQAAKNLKWMEMYKPIILDQKQYPVKPQNIVKNAPNYTLALQRISIPISNALNGISMERIDPDNGDDKNGWLKHYLINTFRQGKFVAFAKLFYYGADGQKMMYTIPQVGKLMETGYNYCLNYSSRVMGCETELNGIMNFINKEGNMGTISTTTPTALNTVQNNNMMKQNVQQGMASTHPQQNSGMMQQQRPINANTNIEIFLGDYFSDILQEGEIINNTTNNQNLSQTNNVPQSSNPQNTINQMQNKSNQQPNGVPVNSAALNYKRKQVAGEIIKDCFNAKLFAMGNIYRDMMYIMKQHVASYKGANAANNNQQQTIQK